MLVLFVFSLAQRVTQICLEYLHRFAAICYSFAELARSA